MKIIAGNSNQPLAREISQILGIDLTKTTITKFADKEINVEIHENMRGEDVFIIQSTSYPANDNLMELMVIQDTLRRSSAKRVTAVVPYFGYARQDRMPPASAECSCRSDPAERVAASASKGLVRAPR